MWLRDASVNRGVDGCLRQHRGFLVLLAAGLGVRLGVAPLWHGQDFAVWTLASSATLNGINVFAHHPHYPAGPFAYFPLFLYIELPVRWLADVSGASFLLLGKLPVIAADGIIATLLYRRATRDGRTARAATIIAGAYLFNPLVLYDGALYGRFDALALALLLAATERARRTGIDPTARGALALSVAAKTFPMFTVPLWFAADSRHGRWKTMTTIVVVLLALSIPYLGSIGAYLHDILWYDGTKHPQGSSVWVLLDLVMSHHDASMVSASGLIVLAGVAVWVARKTARTNFDLAVAAVLLVFVACSKVVLEQYLLWPMPWLLTLVASGGMALRRTSAAMIALLTVLGLLNCETYHPFGRNVPLFGVLLAVSIAVWLGMALRCDAVRSKLQTSPWRPARHDADALSRAQSRRHPAVLSNRRTPS